MVELRTFGGLEITGIDPDQARMLLAQPRRVALLLYMATQPGSSAKRRDGLAAMFWPDADAGAARLSLRQAVSFIRKAIGEHALVAGGDRRGEEEISVNRELIRCDVTEFERLIAAGELTRAAELYRGDFLSGFPPTGIHEFERYRDERAERLSAQARAAVTTLGTSAAAAGNAALAGHWARRALAMDPADESIVAFAMRTLAEGGDRAAAIEAYDAYARITTQDFEDAPSPELAALASSLRDPAPAVAAAVVTPAVVTPARVAIDPVHTTRKPNSVRNIGIGALLFTAIVAAAALTNRDRRAQAEGGRTLTISSFTSPSAGTLTPLGEGLKTLLGARLAGDPGWALAEDDGDEVLSGSVVQSGSTLTVAAVVRARDDERILMSANAEGSPDSLGAIADRLAAKLLLQRAGYPGTDPDRFTRRSLAVLREFLRGEVAMRESRHEDALRAFEAALTADTTFAEAALGQGAAGRQTGAWSLWQRGLRAAFRRRGELSRGDSLYLMALAGPRFPRPSSHADELDAWERLVDQAPERVEGWYELGDILLRWGAVIDVPDHRTRAKAALGRALELRPDAPTPVMPLVEIAIAEQDTATVRRLNERYVAAHRVGDVEDYLRWRIALFLGEERTLDAMRARFDSLSYRTLLRMVGMAQVDNVGMEDAKRAVARLRAQSGARAQQGNTAMVLAHWELNNGNAAAAARARITTSTQDQRDVVLDALYGGGDTAVAARVARAIEDPDAALRPGSGIGGQPGVARTRGENACLLGQWKLWHRLPIDVGSTVSLLRAMNRPEHDNCAVLVTAIDAVLNSRPNAAAAVDSLDAELRLGMRPSNDDTYGEIALARLLSARGERERALRVVQRRPYHHWWGPWYRGGSLALERELRSSVKGR